MKSFKVFLESIQKNTKALNSYAIKSLIDFLKESGVDLEKSIFACDDIYIYQNPDIRDSNISKILSKNELETYRAKWKQKLKELFEVLPEQFVINDSNHAKKRGDKRYFSEIFKKLVIYKNSLGSDNIAEIKTNGLGMISKITLRLKLDNEIYRHFVLSLAPIKTERIKAYVGSLEEILNQKENLNTEEKEVAFLNGLTGWNRIITGNTIVNDNSYSLRNNDVAYYGLASTLETDLRKEEFLLNFNKLNFEDFQSKGYSRKEFEQAKSVLRFFIETVNFNRRKFLSSTIKNYNGVYVSALETALEADDYLNKYTISVFSKNFDNMKQKIKKNVPFILAEMINKCYGFRTDENGKSFYKDTNEWKINEDALNYTFINIKTKKDFRRIIEKEILEKEQEKIFIEKINEISKLREERIEKAKEEELINLEGLIKNILKMKDEKSVSENIRKAIYEKESQMRKVLDVITKYIKKSYEKIVGNNSIKNSKNPKFFIGKRTEKNKQKVFARKRIKESKLLRFIRFAMIL